MRTHVYQEIQAVTVKLIHTNNDGVGFGGNSGGPMIDPATGTVVGMVHGHMVWGRDDVWIHAESQPSGMQVGSTESPIPITYASSCAMIKELWETF